jgi:hypothetical protein
MHAHTYTTRARVAIALSSCLVLAMQPTAVWRGKMSRVCGLSRELKGYLPVMGYGAMGDDHTGPPVDDAGPMLMAIRATQQNE